MEDEEAGALQKGGDFQMVTSVGNAWLMSRSKSHSGRVFYFNTVTGESVWNLSAEEIKRAKALNSQPGTFPEPKGPPGDHTTPASGPIHLEKPQVSEYGTPKVYNKQIINNQFARAPYSPFVTQTCQNCSPVQNMVGVPQQQPFNPVWVQPPPIFLTTPNTSMHNVSQTAENVCQHQEFHPGLAQQNTSISLSRRFEYFNKKCKNFNGHPQGKNKFNKRRMNIFHQRKQPFISKNIQTPRNIGDLRAKLSARKTVPNETPNEPQKNYENKVQECVSSHCTTQSSQTYTLEDKATHDNVQAIGDDEWLKMHGSIDGAKLKLDVTDLKNLATNNLECECWYIVPDRNVLLHHFNFLNVLTNSDPQCKLMVVRGVMSDLQAAARADATKDEARKVLRGLSQLFAAKLAVIAEYTFKPIEIKDCSGMINFCTKLLEQNEHVILVSNEERLEKHSKVPTFSISEVKELLTREKTKPFCQPIIERNIKITIPNYGPNDIADDMEMSVNDMERTPCEKSTVYDEITTCHGETAFHDVGVKPSNIENTDDGLEISANKTTTRSKTPVQKYASATSSTKNIRNTKETNIQTDTVLYTIKMVDAEVQTDARLEFQYPTVQKDSIGINTVEDNMNERRYVDRETSIDNSIGFEKTAISNGEFQTREIRLNRSMSNQTIRSANESMHNKWHRKKRGDSLLSDSTLSLDRVSRASNYGMENNTLRPSLQELPCPSRCQSTQMCYEDVFDGSETSSCILQRPSSENIIIEETSTSDVISNSTSNEIVRDITKSKEKADEVQSKNVMFEITSKAMELNLKTRCDEWMAQFIQIMEEVLGQVLEREHKQIANAMPPPWTLHEATECVKRIFSGDSDVVDAATKLSQVIFRMSDAKGKIIVSFKPNDFMELYSYGVYLVDALQSIMEKFEDLQIAAESLAKLLSDIENPITDSGHNNSFDDITDVSVVISQSSAEGLANKETQRNSNKSTPTNTQSGFNKSSPSKKQDGLNKSTPTTPQKIPKNADTNTNKTSVKYNLRSASKKKINEDKMETSPVKFIRKVNIHDDFFMSLNLQRKEGATTVPRILKTQEANNIDDKEKEPNKSPEADKPTDKGPNIIRNFTKCQEFEERLKNQSSEPLDMDMLDYSMCYEDECDNMEETYSDDYEHNQEHSTEEIKEKNTENDIDNTEDINNNNFKVFVSSMVHEFKETMVSVLTFCKKVQEELQSQNMQIDKKNDAREKALNAKYRILSISDSLRRIKECNFSQNGDRFQSRLKEAGVILNENEVSVYREVIDSCVGHGDTLAESLSLIIDAVNT